MADDRLPVSWQMITAAITIAISLFGNFVQYRSMQAKQREIEQAQQKIDQAQQQFDAARRVGDDCRRAVDTQQDEFDTRMLQLEKNIEKATLEIIRLERAVVVFLTDPQEIKMAIADRRAAEEERKRLEIEKKALQEKIDQLPSKKSACPSM